ncbi:hypothetical protein FIU74_12950 [Lactobacillus buchneri]|nr:hypothetical protein [Lentilactobacillus buchneri]
MTQNLMILVPNFSIGAKMINRSSRNDSLLKNILQFLYLFSSGYFCTVDYLFDREIYVKIKSWEINLSFDTYDFSFLN